MHVSLHGCKESNPTVIAALIDTYPRALFAAVSLDDGGVDEGPSSTLARLLYGFSSNNLFQFQSVQLVYHLFFNMCKIHTYQLEESELKKR